MAKKQPQGRTISIEEAEKLLLGSKTEENTVSSSGQSGTISVEEAENILQGGQKKKPMESPSASPQKKSFSDLKGQLVSGPSASFGQLGNRLPSSAPLKEPELPSTQGELLRAQPKPKPYNLKDKAWLEKNPVLWNSKEQISEWENIKRILEGGTYEATAAVDYGLFGPMAMDWAEHIAMSGFGLNEDYNKLSPEAKKIVKQTIRGQAGATAMMGQTAMAQEKLAEFWKKEAEKVLGSAIQREGDSFTDMANFVEHPSAESAKNLIYRGLETTARTVPYMVATAVTGGDAGLVLAGTMAAGTAAQEEEQKTGNRGVGYLLSNAYTGIAEGYFEKYTQGLLKKAGGLVKGDVKAAENLAKGFVESIAEDFGVEGVSEGLTTLTQELASKLALGEEIDGWDLARKVADSTIMGEFSGTGISVGGQVAGRTVKKSKEAINNYLATKFLTAEQEETLTKNTNTINELRTQVSSPDTSPAVVAIAKKKIAELESANKAIKDEVYTAAENLNVKGSILLIGLDQALRSNRKQAEDIINDSSVADPTKKILLQDLLDEHNQLKQQKDALQKQTTGEIPFQPEAGAGGEMAEGISEAEPQVPTEEGQGQEIAPLKPEDISFGTAFDIQNSTAEQTTGREKDTWGDAQVWRERIENSGDILRELSSRGERPDPRYLLEKVNKLRNWIKSNKKYPSEPIPDDIKTIDDFNKTNLRFTNTVDSYEYLNKFYSDVLEKTKKQYEEIPTYTKEQELALDLTIDLLNNDLNGLESKLNEIENIANKIKQEGKLEIIPNVKLSKAAQKNQQVQPTEEVAVEELGETPTPEVEQAAKKSGVPVTGIWSMFKVNKNVFGLNNAQALASAIVMDRMIGAMAKRSGKTKEQIYKTIDFKKVKNVPKGALYQKNNEENQKLGNLAPNGKPSNLTPGQYKQVRTPEFKAWFGDWENDPENASKILDENGEPMVVYHGTSKDKDFFKFSVPQNGAWFTTDPAVASGYAIQNDSQTYKRDYDTGEYVDVHTSGRVLPVFLNIRNPVDFKTTDIINPKERTEMMGSNYKAVQRRLFGKIFYDKSIEQRKAGDFNDGIYFEPGVIVAILGSNQIKSAIGNKGTFSTQKDSMLMQGTQGAMRIAANGRAIIYAITNPNVSTPLHELAHVFEQYLTEDERNKILSWAGQKEWTRETSEKFARGFEKYLSDGKAPTTALKQIFEQFKEWLLDIYNGIKNSDIDVELNDSMRKIYDSMLSQKAASTKKSIFSELEKGIEAEEKFDEVYKRRFEKTKDKLKAFGSARTALLKTDAYAAATRQQRLDMLSYLRDKYKMKMDTNLEATRAQLETSKQTTAEEIISTIKDYLSRAIQEGVKRGAKRTKEALQSKRKAEKKVLADTIEKIKKMIDKSSLKASQAKAILNGLKLNLSNEKTMARYMERVDKIMKNVEYAEKLNKANDLKSKIKKLMSAKNIAAQNQLAKDFLTLSPDLSKNIDKYLEVADSVYNAITRGQRTPAVIADVEAYVAKAQAYEKELIQNTLDDIAEKAKAKLLKENQDLVDAGVLSADMTLDDINEYLYSINNLGEEKVDQVKEKKKVLLEQAKEVFDALAPIAEMMVSEGIDPFTGEEIEIDKSTKDLINRLLDVDLDKLDGADAYRLANSLQEFLVNGVVDDLEVRLDAYESIREAERLEKKGVKSTISPSKFGPIAFISKLWDINIKPLKSLLAKAFNGRIAGTEIFNSSGLRGISLGAARAKRIAAEIISKYDKMYKDRRPNKKAFDDAYNTYERGVFAFLSRNINKATPEQTKAEFDRRMKLIGETIKNLRDTNKSELIAMADVIESIYDKVKDSESIEDVAKFIDPTNQEAVNYWMEEFKKYYPEVKFVARSTYNTILEDDSNYTPDTFFKIIPDETQYNPSGVYKMTSSLVKTKRSGSLLENKRTPSIRDEKDPTSNNLGVSFDFDLNMANTFQKTLVDIKTAPSIMYFKNFVNSAAFNRMVPNAEVRKTLKDRMMHYADSIREKDGSNYEEIVKEADAIVRRISRYSTQRALGSISNIAKQTLPIFVNTFVNLNGSGDISIFRAGLRSISDPDIQKAIDESGYPISNRGLESQTSLDSADKLLKKADLNDRKSIFDTIDELGQKRLENFLKKPDVYAARAAWVSYYLQDQKRKGVDINRIDWSKPLDKESANYAEDMVDLQQNTSESSSMGKLFSSKSPGTSLVRQFLFGYASFVFNQKDKVYTDVGILFSQANQQEKEMAAKSLISTVAEMAMFEFVSMALSEVIMGIASSIVGGDDEDKETMMDRFNRMFKRAYTNTTASLLSPAPLLDKVVIYLLNQAITGAGNLLPSKEEVKKKGDKKKDETFFYEEKGYAASPVTSALNYLGGAPGVSARAAMSVFNNAQRIFSSQYQDVFGNDVQFSDKDKLMIAGALAFQILAAGNLLPSEAERIANSVVIEVEKGARKSKKKTWRPM